eukprot:TRINITY_DN1660_c0_g3_i1.p1 TRINITY_DN1660_c0_g3~~TRINITY_DN1660_c0_g3_i1.p1  ORF type:complete len:249 (+),score=56.83 TRINITY_DN1660_c0_g3_i1:643-1389(+)
MTEHFSPELRLVGQKKEGFGLSWNKFKRGLLLGASHDGSVCSWDIEGMPKPHNTLEPVARYEGHTGAVEDVVWSRQYADMFASAGDDKKILLWDARKEGKKPTHQVEAHSGEVLSLDFNPFNEHLLASSSSDKTVAIWDIRNLQTKQCSLKQHQDEVCRISWATFNEAVIASASQDRRVFIWDLSCLGKEQTSEEAVDGPPELLFIHGGHTGKVTEISWNPNEELVMASVADDNILQIWQIVNCEIRK